MSARVLHWPAPSLRLELQQQPRHDFGADITPLVIYVEWMRYCELCDSEQLFIAKESCSLGLIGRCQKCGDAKVGRWTRANTEVTRPNSDWEDYT